MTEINVYSDIKSSAFMGEKRNQLPHHQDSVCPPPCVCDEDTKVDNTEFLLECLCSKNFSSASLLPQLPTVVPDLPLPFKNTDGIPAFSTCPSFPGCQREQSLMDELNSACPATGLHRFPWSAGLKGRR